MALTSPKSLPTIEEEPAKDEKDEEVTNSSDQEKKVGTDGKKGQIGHSKTSKEACIKLSQLMTPKSVTVPRGSPICIKVKHIKLKANVTWMKKGKVLSQQSDTRVSILRTSGASVLIVRNADSDDSGKYVARVVSETSCECHFISVAVVGPPEPPPEAPQVTPLTKDTVHLSWKGSNFDGGSVITNYLVEVLTDDDDNNNDNEDESISTDPQKPNPSKNNWCPLSRTPFTSATLYNLYSPNGYSFRVRAENCYGLSGPSSETSISSIQECLKSKKDLDTDDRKDGDNENDFSLESKSISVLDGVHFKDTYEMKEEIGRGRFGIVYRCIHKGTSKSFAAKFVKTLKREDKKRIQEEIQIMSILRHPKLLQIEAAFANKKDTILVTEYISGGELFEKIIREDYEFTESHCIRYTRQVLDGVHYMHTNNIAHLDLKPENILLVAKESQNIKIIDFGLARLIEPGKEFKALAGTPEFVAPEVINYEPVTVKSDMWSIGVICYVLLSGLSPFLGENDPQTLANVAKAEFDFEDDAFVNLSPPARDFICNLLRKKPSERMSAKEALSHSWMSLRRDSTDLVKLSKERLKKFYYRRKWQKSGNAIRALTRLSSFSGTDSEDNTDPS